MGYFKNVSKTFKIKNYVNYIGVGAFLILMIALNMGGFLARSTVSLLSQIAYSIILAVSLNLVVGFLGELSLGHAGFMCVGAYIGCLFANYMHKVISSDLVVLILSMLVGGLVAAVFGFIIGLPALRLKGDYLAIVTLAFGEIVRNIFKNLELFGGALGLNTVKYNTESLFIVAFITVLIVLFLIQNLIQSKHGRAITSIRDNEIASWAMGINVTFYKLFVFVVSAFFAGIAGVIYGHWVTPVLYSFFSYNYSIEILVMVVLGGMGNISGSIIAATLITYVNFILQKNLSGNLAALKFLVYAMILIIVVLFNNAPAFKPIKEKLNISKLLSRFQKKNHPERIKNDAADWEKIESKIKMNEVLTVDLPQGEDKASENAEEEK